MKDIEIAAAHLALRLASSDSPSERMKFWLGELPDMMEAGHAHAPNGRHLGGCARCMADRAIAMVPVYRALFSDLLEQPWERETAPKTTTNGGPA